MTKTGKILAVFLTVIALCFMAFAGASILGGPNWMGRAEELTDYRVTVNPGPPVSYSAKHRFTDENKGSGDLLPRLVISLQRDQKQKLSEEEQSLDQNLDNLKRLIAEAERLQTLDLVSLAAKEQELTSRIEEISTEIDATHKMITQVVIETKTLTETLGLRTEDVLRLRDQLAILRADHERLVAQKSQLIDVLTLLEGSIDQLQRRNEQLQSVQPATAN